jgi:hypothetical protein
MEPYITACFLLLVLIFNLKMEAVRSSEASGNFD